jgi:hypothetical protein
MMSSHKLPQVVRWLRDAALIGLIALGLLLVAEVVVRLVAPQDVRHDYTQGGSIGLPDDQLGHVYRPGAVSAVRGPEFQVEYRINEEGLRDETAHPTPRARGSRRLLVLGDSFAFGAGNEYDRIWPVLLEQELRRRGHGVDVVKAGVSAYDTAKELIYLERLFPRYEPDVVLVAFLPNDLFTNRSVEQVLYASSRAADDEAVRGRADRRFTLHLALLAKRMLIASDLLYVKLYLASPRAQYFASPPAERLTEQLALTRELFARMQRSCEERGISLVVLSIPQQFQVLARAGDYDLAGVDPGVIDQAFARYAQEDGYVWLPSLHELASTYEAAGENLYFRLDGHLTHAGNAVVARVALSGVEPLLTEGAGTGAPAAPGTERR